jgi:FMN reductase (NADPH)
MTDNPIIQSMLNRKSIRRYKDEMPSDETIHTVARAGQQAPFSYQLCSVLLTRQKKTGKKKNPFRAPLLFTICVDSHRLELVMQRRNWKMVTNDLSLLFFGIQDAALLAENMVMAAESLGLGSCFLGGTPYQAEKIIKAYKLPPRVFPLVQLTMGYPAENPPPRPRYPLEFSLFEEEYPQFDEEIIRKAMAVMDEGYLAQDYYRKARYIISLDEKREETFTYENYSWTEHISRKAGLWLASPEELVEQLAKCGFQIPKAAVGEERT